MSLFVLNTPSFAVRPIGAYPQGWTKRSSARAALRQEVKASAQACRRAHGRAGVIKHSADSYEIRIGNRQGYHLWERLMVGTAPKGTRVDSIIES